jgi:hypothetical protein
MPSQRFLVIPKSRPTLKLGNIFPGNHIITF